MNGGQHSRLSTTSFAVVSCSLLLISATGTIGSGSMLRSMEPAIRRLAATAMINQSIAKPDEAIEKRAFFFVL